VTVLEQLADALKAPRLDVVEGLRAQLTGAEDDPTLVRSITQRLAELSGKPVTDGHPLSWWIDGVLLQKVVTVPTSRNRQLFPLLVVALAVLLGLLVGRIPAAAVIVVGLVFWAMRFGGSPRERHGPWLRLGNLIFDLRVVRIERVDAQWANLEGHRVPLEVLTLLAERQFPGGGV
jgi:hypothetical protein